MALPSFQQRLASFRDQLKAQNIDCFIQSTADAHQSEYVCNRDKRIGFLSGFTGSAGTIVVTLDKALLWTDGRYHIAANKQLSSEWTLMKQGLPDTPSVEKWIKAHVQGNVGIDPFLCSLSYHNRVKDALCRITTELVMVEKNPIDVVWGAQQPSIPSNKVFVHELKYSGRNMQDKIKNVQQKINEYDVQALIVTKLDHIAWLLNLRGNDIVYNPVFFSYLIVTRTDILLYIDPSKVEPNDEEKQPTETTTASDLKQHLSGIQIVPYENFLTDLKRLVSESAQGGGGAGKFWYDPRCTNMSIFSAVPKEQRFEKDDCIEIMKAVKNETEVQGFMNCHVRDGAAKSRFFAWVQSLRDAGQAELEKHTEWSFAEKLLSLRREADLFVDLSFETISSIGANGAVIHYSPTESEHAAVRANEMYLLDSGGQYFDGTTDTTRTYWLGVGGAAPSDYQRECYTRVLKGVIALTKMVFPSNTKGPMIDSVARSFLWQIGLDFRHGTGHGVGFFLNVHEGPHGFSASTFRRALFEYGLKENMVITNEPGYYEADKFGIRIENVMVVKPVKTKYAFDNQQFCSFTTATMVPIDKELLDMSIMNDAEIEWLNSYHAQVYANILPFMQTQFEKDWLKKATDPVISKN